MILRRLLYLVAAAVFLGGLFMAITLPSRVIQLPEGQFQDPRTGTRVLIAVLSLLLSVFFLAAGRTHRVEKRP